MSDAVELIFTLLKQTAKSLKQSFDTYWPAFDDSNDPTERNVTLHFGHAMLSEGFATFAEAQLPIKTLGTCHIDVLGLEPGSSWFVGGEFKKLFSPQNLTSLMSDIERLRSFCLRTHYPTSNYHPNFAAAASRCTQGYGVIGGLHAAMQGRSSILQAWTNPALCSRGSVYETFARRLAAIEAHKPPPQFICDFPTGYRYYLLAAVFPITSSETATPVPV